VPEPVGGARGDDSAAPNEAASAAAAAAAAAAPLTASGGAGAAKRPLPKVSAAVVQLNRRMQRAIASLSLDEIGECLDDAADQGVSAAGLAAGPDTTFTPARLSDRCISATAARRCEVFAEQADGGRGESARGLVGATHVTERTQRGLAAAACAEFTTRPRSRERSGGAGAPAGDSPRARQGAGGRASLAVALLRVRAGPGTRRRVTCPRRTPTCPSCPRPRPPRHWARPRCTPPTASRSAWSRTIGPQAARVSACARAGAACDDDDSARAWPPAGPKSCARASRRCCRCRG
jgi:hypothetical protein